jgi:uncharacterized protein (DUF1499 family)
VLEQAQLCVEPRVGKRQATFHRGAHLYSDDPAQARERLDRAVAGIKRARVVEHEANYWRVEFTSALWRFVDDVEFLFDDNARRIDIRSASRVGYSDLGVNRRRIEEIRGRFSAR